jgi:hypothetical protein
MWYSVVSALRCSAETVVGLVADIVTVLAVEFESARSGGLSAGKERADVRDTIDFIAAARVRPDRDPHRNAQHR